MRRAFKTLAAAAAKAIDGKKGEAILVLDVRKKSPLADYLVIATALSKPHLQAIEDEVEEELGRTGLRVHRRNKPQTDQWRVLDFGGLIVHLMTEETRALYGLERLHEDAKEVAWRS